MERPSALGRPAYWWGAALVWWLVNGLANASHYRLLSGASDDPVPWSRALLTSTTSALIWVPITVLAIHLTRRHPLERGSLRGSLAVHLLAAAGVILVRALAVLVLNPWVRWYPADVPPFGRLLVTSVYNNLFIYLLVVGVAHALYYAHQARERTAQLAQARLQALTAQLHPHFLFNALNAVSSLMADDPERAERVLARLGLLLRRSLAEAPAAEVPLREELDFVAAYLEVEQARFEERLAVSWNVDPLALELCVPPLLLQPIVENAVKHGIAPAAYNGTVHIEARRVGDRLRLEVRDDGAGLRPDAPLHERDGAGSARPQLGLANTRARLAAAYGDRQSLQLRPGAHGGTVVTIEIPARTSGDGGAGAHRGHRPELSRGAPALLTS